MGLLLQNSLGTDYLLHEWLLNVHLDTSKGDLEYLEDRWILN
jgi:hypothetical protein